MENRDPTFTENDQEEMCAFLRYVLNEYKSNKISELDAVEAIARVMTSIDIGNYTEARNWFENRENFVHGRTSPRERISIDDDDQD